MKDAHDKLPSESYDFVQGAFNRMKAGAEASRGNYFELKRALVEADNITTYLPSLPNNKIGDFVANGVYKEMKSSNGIEYNKKHLDDIILGMDQGPGKPGKPTFKRVKGAADRISKGIVWWEQYVVGDSVKLTRSKGLL